MKIFLHPVVLIIIVIICFETHTVVSVPLRCNIYISKRTIDCSGRELTNTIILVEADEGEKIDSINYSNNNIQRIESLSRFPNVTKIELNWNMVENISANAFSALEKLTYLNLSYNNLEYVDPYLLIQNKQLKSLSLEGNLLKVTEEKPIICSASLQILSVARCSLSVITRENLLCLPSLTELDVSYNGLTSLTPSVFSPLSHLMSINLGTNRFYCDCKLPELLKWARSKKTDMSSSEEVFCVLPNNGGRIEFEKVEKDLNCSSTLPISSLKLQNENSSSEFYDYILISYDTSVQPADGRVSLWYMGIISNKLYTIEALLSLVVFLLVLITGMLFCRHYRTLGDISDSINETSVYDPFLSDKMSTHLIQRNPKQDHMYVHVK